jgi:HTH-type transcriptional regulator/antitoxin HigA
MNVRPIRSDADYEAHLARIAALMNAAAGSNEADELDVLTTLVERYEEKQFPIEAPTPVEAIRFRMEQLGWTPRDLEPFIGSRSRVSEVLNGTRALSIDMIRALHRDLEIPAEVLIREDPLSAAKAPAALSKPAKKQLTDWSILGPHENMESLLSRAFGDGPAVVALRKTRTERTNAKTDMTSLSAWCAAAVLKSHEIEVDGKFSASRLDEALRQIAQLSVHADGPIRARQALSNLGVALVVLPHLPGTYLDGAAMRRPDGTPVVALTLRRDRIDNFWFTLLHESIHVARHLGSDQEMILDDLEIGSMETIEKEADEFAATALVPDELWSKTRIGKTASLRDVLGLAAQAGVNPAIVAGRWQRTNGDYRKFAKLLGHGSVRVQFKDFPVS